MDPVLELRGESKSRLPKSGNDHYAPTSLPISHLRHTSLALAGKCCVRNNFYRAIYHLPLCILVSLIALLQATTYPIDPSGRSLDKGSSQRPWYIRCRHYISPRVPSR